MKEEIARGWAAYLRTPGLKQARYNLLREDGSACCLGHLCIFLGAEKKFNPYREVYEFSEGNTALLPRDVRSQAGMHSVEGRPRDDNGFVVRNRNYLSLTDANDSGDLTLPEIADLIEDNWERL